MTATLISGLREAGHVIQPFKLGPDFIDTAYLGEAAGRDAITLDLWMMGAEGVLRSYRRWSEEAEVAVVEAMGALHDGTDGTGDGRALQETKAIGAARAARGHDTSTASGQIDAGAGPMFSSS